ncbi:MAG: DUF4954 family protein [Mariniphaga sp.]|nr:DUF4954 family protein [Mariniphaga sp.]
MYRRLSEKEIEKLQLRRCSAENWNNIEVKDPFLPERLFSVHFSGPVKLGSNTGKIETADAFFKLSGIFNCTIQNCTIGDDVFLSNIGSLANYSIANNVSVENVGAFVVSEKTTFGNGHEIEILNEGGGRELPIFDKLSAQIAYLMVVYRHNKQLTRKLKLLIGQYVKTKESCIGEIGEGTKIRDVKTIINVKIGNFATIRGASLLKEGTISSNREAPVFIGENVTATHFIVLSGSKIDTGAMLSSTFVGQGVLMGKQFSSENSAFFANCEAFHSEACSIFAGPYTVTHHRSTLLIAGLFSFFNAGSGTNQSNHMYKLGPVHQGIVERGSKTGSFSYMLWPCRVGAFSVVMDKHAGNFDTTDLPFSYITVEEGKSVLTPAMNLFTVGTARDAKKWPARDRRKDPKKIDLLHFEVLNPLTGEKILTGIRLLELLQENTPKTREFVLHKGVHINRLMLRTSKRYYELAFAVYITGELVKRMENSAFKSLEELKNILLPKNNSNTFGWVDLAGMYAKKEHIDHLVGSLVSEKITTVDDLHRALQQIFEMYSEDSWNWCVSALKSWKNFDVKNFTFLELEELLAEWKTSAVKFNNMILKDAEKEFDQLSRISFGPDGDETEQLADFESIRGKYETNNFIVGVRNETKEIEYKYEKLKNRIAGSQA